MEKIHYVKPRTIKYDFDKCLYLIVSGPGDCSIFEIYFINQQISNIITVTHWWTYTNVVKIQGTEDKQLHICNQYFDLYWILTFSHK